MCGFLFLSPSLGSLCYVAIVQFNGLFSVALNLQLNIWCYGPTTLFTSG